MATKHRITITVDPDVAALLEKTGNASGYITRAVRERWAAWQDALDTLRACGWRRGEVLSACDALNGYHLLGPGRAPNAIALELADYARLRGLREELGVSPQRWSALARKVGDDAALALALTTVAQEFWADNDACEAAIDRL